MRALYNCMVLLLLAITTKTIIANNNYQCPNQTTTNCECSPDVKKMGRFVITCLDTNTTMTVTIDNYQVKVRCDLNLSPSAYKELPLPVGQNIYLKKITFKNCPLPETSIAEIVNDMGINNQLDIIFQSGLVLNDTLSMQLKGLKNVKTLNLQYNGFTHLADNIFDRMTSLDYLDLRNNKIELTRGNPFKSLFTVTVLDLYSNKISKLPKDIFCDMYSLLELYIWKNKLSDIIPGAFNCLNNLTRLDLSSNDLKTLPSEIFKTLPNLCNLQIKGNKITTLPDGLFLNNKKLNILLLSYNMLSDLPDYLLANAENLKQVDLQHNQLQMVPHNLFKESTALEKIDLSNNKLKNIPINLFSDQKNLKKLYLRYNRIKSLSSQVFHTLSDLKELYLNNNALDCLQSFNLTTASSPNSSPQLERMYLSNNYISKNCDEDSQFYLGKLRDLNLKNNTFTEINYEQFVNNNSKVDLSFNNISKIKFEHGADHLLNINSSKVFLEGNPIICDCELYDYIKYLKNKHDGDLSGMNSLICVDPPHLKGTPIGELKLDDLVCQVTESCPTQCECDIRYVDMAYCVKCTNITEVPDTDVQMRRLGMNQTELHLEDNQITSFTQLHLDTLNRNVTRLFLRNNNITDLYISENMEVLDLRNNLLHNIDDVVTQSLKNSRVRELSLSGNNIACDCKNAAFLSLLKELNNNHRMKDLNSLTCPGGQKVSGLDVQLLCADVDSSLVLLLVLLCLACLLIILVQYKYNHVIKVFLFTNGYFHCFLIEEDLDKDKTYDAFISYSHKDEDLVHKIVTELEYGPHSYKLCIHVRDWTVGEMISTQIKQSVEDSRRTIVVLSPDFLDSVWGQVEFKEAHSCAIKEGRSRLIIILYGEINELGKLDPEFQVYLKNNTYLKWGDPLFWEKLRYALPHRSSPQKEKATKIAEIKSLDESYELNNHTQLSTNILTIDHANCTKLR